MGWVSTLEDIVERLTSDLDNIKRNYRTKSSTVEDRPKLQALIRTCEKFIDDVNKHMELATSPEINLAAELLELKKENAVLRAKVKELEDTKKKLGELTEKYQTLEKDFMHVNAKSAKRFAQVKEMEDSYKRLEKSYARSGKIKR